MTTTNTESAIVRHAVIITAHDAVSPIPSVECCSLLPFIDRPVLQHCVEAAVRCGAESIDVIASDGLHGIRELLGDGERWGVIVRVQGVVGASGWNSALRTACTGHDTASRTLILSTQRLIPNLSEQLNGQVATNLVWMTHNGDWAGSAVIHSETLRKQTVDQVGEQNCLSTFFNGFSVQEQTEFCSTSSLSMFPAKDLLASQYRVLKGEFPVLTQHLKTAETGVWIGRDIRIHPTAKLVAPLLIGSNSDIDEGTQIGPNAVIGSNTIILRDTIAANCYVLPYTSVGEDLCLQDCLVEPSCIHNTAIGATLGIHDNVLVADIRRDPLSGILSRKLSRAVAAVLYVVLSVPAMIYRTLLRLRGVTFVLQDESFAVVAHRAHISINHSIRLRRYLADPNLAEQTSGVRQQWDDLFLRIVPRLIAVMQGKLRLIGVNLWTEDSLNRVPKHWLETLCSQQPGLLTESLIQYGPLASFDDRCVCDAWSAVSLPKTYRWKAVARYIRSLVMGPESMRHQRVPAVACLDSISASEQDFPKSASSVHPEESTLAAHLKEIEECHI